MKRITWSTLLSLCLAGSAVGQTESKPLPLERASETPAQNVKRPKPVRWNFRPGARDWNSTEWQWSEVSSNEVTGELTEQLHHYVEVGDGLNYINEQGQWQESKDVVELSTNGAAAIHGPTKMYFGPNLNAENPLTIVTRSNTVLRLRPIGLY